MPGDLRENTLDTILSKSRNFRFGIQNYYSRDRHFYWSFFPRNYQKGISNILMVVSYRGMIPWALVGLLGRATSTDDQWLIAIGSVEA